MASANSVALFCMNSVVNTVSEEYTLRTTVPSEASYFGEVCTLAPVKIWESSKNIDQSLACTLSHMMTLNEMRVGPDILGRMFLNNLTLANFDHTAKDYHFFQLHSFSQSTSACTNLSRLLESSMTIQVNTKKKQVQFRLLDLMKNVFPSVSPRDYKILSLVRGTSIVNLWRLVAKTSQNRRRAAVRKTGGTGNVDFGSFPPVEWNSSNLPANFVIPPVERSCTFPPPIPAPLLFPSTGIGDCDFIDIDAFGSECTLAPGLVDS